ncbi:hypothetical protein A2U01_0002234 [Trifolium medium]|uniref:Uncharacterized protein n=1 Tax=Trifolium medium TaxID=97028 RepID=A0A392M285_9FABA|nr:hypothetical protein [Trifolium medium]
MDDMALGMEEMGVVADPPYITPPLAKLLQEVEEEKISPMGLRTDSMFKKKLGLKEPKSMSELLTRAQPYLNYEEKLLADKVEKDKRFVKNSERGEKVNKGTRGNYSESTPLNTTTETILQKCVNTEFVEA